MRLILFVFPLAIFGCTQFPELDNAVSDRAKEADFPTLVPIQSLLAQSATITTPPEQTISTLTARADALRNRAARLQGEVVDANTRERMRNGVK